MFHSRCHPLTGGDKGSQGISQGGYGIATARQPQRAGNQVPLGEEFTRDTVDQDRLSKTCITQIRSTTFEPRPPFE
jgi:hypothetical protein